MVCVFNGILIQSLLCIELWKNQETGKLYQDRN